MQLESFLRQYPRGTTGAQWSVRQIGSSQSGINDGVGSELRGCAED